MAIARTDITPGTRYQPITGRPAFVWAFLDAMVLARRSVLRTLRAPELIVFVAIQPVMFVLLFRYVFGGAIQVPGGQYVNYLMPGIFVQTVAFGGVITGIGLAEDMHQGLIDRFRSLPMSSSAVVSGRTVADLARNGFTVAIMLIVGFLVGFRPQGTIFEFMLGILVLMGISFAFSWISAFIGLAVRSVEAAQSGGFIWMFPLTFASSAFVPVSTMPSWLRPFAEHNPVTVLSDALRGLFHVNPALTTADTRWDLIQSVAGVAVLLPDSYNRRGRIVVNGVKHTVQIKYEHDQSTPNHSATLVQKLITDEKAQFILGPYGSAATATDAIVAEKNGVPMVEANGAAQSIFSKGYKFTFGVLSPANKYLTGVLDMAATLSPKPTTIAMLTANANFSVEMTKAVEDYAPSNGMQVVLSKQYPAAPLAVSEQTSQAR